MNNYRIEFELYDIINSLFANSTQYFSLHFSIVYNNLNHKLFLLLCRIKFSTKWVKRNLV